VNWPKPRRHHRPLEEIQQIGGPSLNAPGVRPKVTEHETPRIILFSADDSLLGFVRVHPESAFAAYRKDKSLIARYCTFKAARAAVLAGPRPTSKVVVDIAAPVIIRAPRPCINFDRITAAEEPGIARRAQAGDEDAATRMVGSISGIIFNIIKEHLGFGDYSFEELVREGKSGAFEAIKHSIRLRDGGPRMQKNSFWLGSVNTSKSRGA